MIEEKIVREIIPRLKALGAEGIIEYPPQQGRLLVLGSSYTVHGFTEKEKKGEDCEATSAASACAKIVIRSVCATSPKSYSSGMSGKDRQGRRLQGSASPVALGKRGLLGWSISAQGAVDDSSDDAPELAPSIRSQGTRKADALVWFVNGLSRRREGPEKALESYRKALTLDLANTDLPSKWLTITCAAARRQLGHIRAKGCR